MRLLLDSDTGAVPLLPPTWRTREPAATLTSHQPSMAVVGITRLANLTGLDTVGIPVYAAYRPLARTAVTSLGKGLDPPAAKASALMESIELWHAEHVEPPTGRVSYLDLRAAGEPVVDLDGIPVARGGRVNLGEPRGWLDGVDLLNGGAIRVPFETVSLNLTGDGVPGLLRSSNGLASGNHRHEALAHALYEVIERDADARWRASPEPRRVDLDTVADPHAMALLERFAAADVRVAAWELTSEIGVPAYGCTILADPAHSWRAVGVHEGAGCHRTPAVALNRALTEAAQARLAAVAGSRDDIFRSELALACDPEVAGEIWHELDEIPATQRFPDGHSPGERTLGGDLRWLLDRLAAAGVEQVAAVDLTRAELGVPVVKVLVPGLLGPAGDCEQA